MPERIIQRSRGFAPDIYFILTFDTKKQFNVKKGCKVECTLVKALDSSGNVVQELNRKVICEVKVRDGWIHVPPNIIQELNLPGREYYEIIVEKLVSPSGVEVEIYPGTMVEKEIKIPIKK
ncbi:MAG: hypothetical protein ACKD6N_07285 [Candidatus Bathyarchaeota archaeon]